MTASPDDEAFMPRSAFFADEKAQERPAYLQSSGRLSAGLADGFRRPLPASAAGLFSFPQQVATSFTACPCQVRAGHCGCPDAWA